MNKNNYTNNNKFSENFNSIKISLASPEIIRSWSYGEVKKPETINYRTFKPERDGLFCAKIFGPIKDYECICGKYRRIKFKGIICEKCGVEITKSKVRRIRMGHIELSSPVVHIWFLKSLPSKIGLLLDISLKDIEKILYFESYIITDVGCNTNLKNNKIISEEEYYEYLNKYNTSFKAKIGAEAIYYLLKNFDLNYNLNLLLNDFKNINSDTKQKKIINRIKLIKSFISSKNKPEWMIMTVLPVLPPDLRPLVPLEGGRFATSDLNDLYRRVINRNNRLKRLIELDAPEIIIKNEKRMLQESVDALFDNGKRGKIITSGSNKRPLKSLSDMIKGKQGRFRQNLLGKRVDYSGRSVITVGPYLKLNQCGLPKKMALELFKPFIYGKLNYSGISNTIKKSKKMVESEDPIVLDILSNIIKNHPVLLNRAPTLHRLGIQSFNPILIEGKSIQLHPLVCSAYNADFDGDQMAIHIPLTLESQNEAKTIMMSTNNILSPANGDPIIIPSQDIILGLYYMTIIYNDESNVKNLIFSSSDEVEKSYLLKIVNLHSKIKLRIKEYKILNNNKYSEKEFIVNTTVGRSILWKHIPKGLEFNLINKVLNKNDILNIINICYIKLGIENTIKFIDKIMYIGFYYSTISGISVSINDLIIPNKKKDIIKKSELNVLEIQDQYQLGLITYEERYNKIIDVWSKSSDKISDLMMKDLSKIRLDNKNNKYLNSIFMMFDSGARGSSMQIRQLSGMRGLMTKPDGYIIETPITANFKEGLNIIQYFISTHGTRKGLADTALKTANSGYLTRRLVDVAQDLVITEYDCNTVNGINIDFKSDLFNIDEKNLFKEKIFGRIISENIYCKNNNILINSNTLIDDKIFSILEKNLIYKLKIRSVITCDLIYGICSRCYGIDLSKGKLVNIGEAVGIIAAQSIGEPGTQLTMRTFHIGGAASSKYIMKSNIKSNSNGIIDLSKCKYVINNNNKILIISKNSEIRIIDNNKTIKESYKIPYGSIVNFSNNSFVKVGEVIVTWDPYIIPIIADIDGIIEFVDIVENITMSYQLDELTGLYNIVILDFIERNNIGKNMRPSINIINNDNVIKYLLPEKSIIYIKNNSKIFIGDFIAKIPKKNDFIKDITGGLPKISDIFEVRKPKDIAILAEISGIVYIKENSFKCKKNIIIKSKNSDNYFEINIPENKQLTVFNGEEVVQGDRISDGKEYLCDLLRLKGIDYTISYILNEVQEIYKLQGVKINIKHIEIIIKQMIKKVSIIDSGSSNFIKGDKISLSIIKKLNKDFEKNNKNKIIYEYNLMGITKSSLLTDSFISSASFQETTKILTDAAISGKVDNLKGLKENVIVGRLIPAGTGFLKYKKNNLI